MTNVEPKLGFGAFIAYDPEEAIDEYGWVWTDVRGMIGWQIIRTDDTGKELRVYAVDFDLHFDMDAFVGRPYVPIHVPAFEADDPPAGVIVTVDAPGGVRTTLSWAADSRSEDLARTIVRALHDLTSNTSSKDH